MIIGNEECRPTVVLVDDEVDYLKLMERWLKPKFNVTCLTGGVDASVNIVALNPDLVIMDVNMPECGGFKISRQLRGQTGFEDLPVIFVTGSKSVKHVAQSLHFSGCRYMLKPLTRKELNNAVSELLGLQMVG